MQEIVNAVVVSRINLPTRALTTMRLVPSGLLILPLGLLLFWKGRRALLWGTIASIPFFMVLVVELPFAPVRAFQYLGGLLILRHVFDRAIQGRAALRKSGTTVSALFFLGVVLLSLFMPLLITESVFVVPEGAGSFGEAYQDPQPLRFDLSNLTQILYPTFGIVLFFTITNNLKTRDNLKTAIRILVLGMVTLALFSFVYVTFHFLGLRNVMTLIFRLMTEVTEPKFSSYNALGGIVRPETLAGEPGYTGLYYVMILGIVGGLAVGGYIRGWRLEWQGTCLFLLTVSILINGSTTAYFGVASLGASFLLVALLRKNRRITSGRSVRVVVRILLAGGGGLLFLVVALETAGISLLEYIVETHLAKLTEEAGSGALRLYAVQYSLTEVFSKSPLLGVGYGSHRALSLVIVLLANIGIVGVLAFLAFNGAVFFHAIRTMNRSQDPELASIAFALAVTHPAFLLTMFVGKSETSFSFGWLWLLLAMMEASYRIYRRRKASIET